jgi:hypothetical protein
MISGREGRHCIISRTLQSEWNSLTVRMTLKVNEGASGCKVVQEEETLT